MIYVAAPLSGDQADGGQSVLGGVRKRADEANRAGGVLGGKKVVVRGLDDQADEDVAVEVAHQVEQAIRAGETVLGVVGHYNSGPTARAMEVYRQLNLVVITPSSSNPDLTRKGYAGGELEILALIDANNTYFDARERYLELLQEAWLEAAEVRLAAGRALVSTEQDTHNE